MNTTTIERYPRGLHVVWKDKLWDVIEAHGDTFELRSFNGERHATAPQEACRILERDP